MRKASYSLLAYLFSSVCYSGKTKLRFKEHTKNGHINKTRSQKELQKNNNKTHSWNRKLYVRAARQHSEALDPAAIAIESNLYSISELYFVWLTKTVSLDAL